MSQEIAAEIRQTVYRALAEAFPFDQQFPMASVVPVIKKAGVDYKDLGFEKAKAFLYEMPEFLSFTDVVQGGVPQVLVTLRHKAEWDVVAPEAGEGDLGVQSVSWIDAARAMADYADPAARVPEDVLAELSDDIRSFCFMPYRYSDTLREAAGVEDAEELIERSWSVAYREGVLRYYEGKVLFPVDAMRRDGVTPIEVSIRRSDPEKNSSLPWFVCYVNTYVGYRGPTQVFDEHPGAPDAGTAPGTVCSARVAVGSGERRSALEVFAYLGSWNAFLKELADIALPENWTLPGSFPFGILRSYITYTFHRLEREGKVLTVPGVMAAFNTGLVDRCYDDIFACFEPQAPGSQSQWKFVGFCKAGQQGQGKRLVNYFNPLPEPARYFDRKEDLFFDADRELVVDYDHILFDNISRLPIGFLRDAMRDDAKAIEVVEGISGLRTADRKGQYAKLVELLQQDVRLLRCVRRRLEDAVEVACKRVRWSFRAAIPCYYPRFDVTSLLLPLCLAQEEAADAALVVQLMDSGIYQGQTIFTMPMAYTDARLICRPESEWLVPATVAADVEDEDEDTESVVSAQPVAEQAAEPDFAPEPDPAPAVVVEPEEFAAPACEPASDSEGATAPAAASTDDEELERIMREILNG